MLLFLPTQSSLKTVGGMDSFFLFLSAHLKDYSGVCILLTFKYHACLLEICQRS